MGTFEVEAALLEAVDEVERGPFEEQLALLIDDDVLAVEVVVAVLGFVVLVVEEQAVLWPLQPPATSLTRRNISGPAWAPSL